jgi:hypothetical protein
MLVVTFGHGVVVAHTICLARGARRPKMAARLAR